MQTSQTARQLARRLAARDVKLVLAESCTGGEVAAQLGRIAGISNWWCGSCVAYRPLAKQAWLGVPDHLIQQHTAESAEVAEALACLALERTAEADLSGAITGHLGPDAPADVDGMIHVATAWRGARPQVQTYRLAERTRRKRQLEAAGLLLRQLLGCLQ